MTDPREAAAQRNRERFPEWAAALDECRRLWPGAEIRTVYVENTDTGDRIGSKPE